MDKPFIPLSVPDLCGAEAEYLADCAATGWVSSVGPYVTRFEQAVAMHAGRKHGIAVVNGSVALYVSLKLLGIGTGDEVIVSNLTFIASANAIRIAGATPVLIDAESDSAQMAVHRVASFLHECCETRDRVTRNSATGNRIAAIMPVHILRTRCKYAVSGRDRQPTRDTDG